MKAATKTKSAPRLLRVISTARITPNMIRVTFSVPDIGPIPDACEGANCKIFLPEPTQAIEDFHQQLTDGPRPTVRTYTVRHIRKALSEMDIDFVDHGEGGPASTWARTAKPNDFCGFAGPGTVKLPAFYADWYLLAADMSALPLVAATLEAMPRDAQGVAFFEIIEPRDKITINAPEGIERTDTYLSGYWKLGMVEDEHQKMKREETLPPS